MLLPELAIGPVTAVRSIVLADAIVDVVAVLVLQAVGDDCCADAEDLDGGVSTMQGMRSSVG